MPKRILFSPIGSTDPIKYFHDGSMLHICRQYKPDTVILYMSKEITQRHRHDNRYIRTIELLEESINHHFDIRVIEDIEFKDVQKYDIYYQLFHDIIKDISGNMDKDDELIVNMASGTPAMKSALLILATLAEYSFTPIQVNSPLNRMNVTYENRNEYDVVSNWQLNKDNELDSDNRCEEVRCMNLIRLLKLETMKKHILTYNYNSALQLISEINGGVSKEIYTMLELANARLNLDFKKVNSLIKDNELNIAPLKNDEITIMSEYICVLETKLKKQAYIDVIYGISHLIDDLSKYVLIKISKAKLDYVLNQKINNVIEFGENIKNISIYNIVNLKDELFNINSLRDVLSDIKNILMILDNNIKNSDWNVYDNINNRIIKMLEC